VNAVACLWFGGRPPFSRSACTNVKFAQHLVTLSPNAESNHCMLLRPNAERTNGSVLFPIFAFILRMLVCEEHARHTDSNLTSFIFRIIIMCIHVLKRTNRRTWIYECYKLHS